MACLGKEKGKRKKILYCTLPCKYASSLEGNLSNFMSGISQETSMKIKINDLMNQSTNTDHSVIPLNPMLCIAMVCYGTLIFKRCLCGKHWLHEA